MNEMEFIDLPEVEGWKPYSAKQEIASAVLFTVLFALVVVGFSVGSFITN